MFESAFWIQRRFRRYKTIRTAEQYNRAIRRTHGSVLPDKKIDCFQVDSAIGVKRIHGQIKYSISIIARLRVDGKSNNKSSSVSIAVDKALDNLLPSEVVPQLFVRPDNLVPGLFVVFCDNIAK